MSLPNIPWKMNLKRERQRLVETVEQQATTLKKAGEALDAEIEQRKQVEGALRIDIAERQKAQEALRETKWRFQRLI